MKTSTPDELKAVLAQHALWLSSDHEQGVRANLRGADLSDADLRGANLYGANLPHFAHCPQEGEFIAYKKLQGGVIAKLRVSADAGRTSSLVGRKCRAEYVEVLELSGGNWDGGPVASTHDGRTMYSIGEAVRPDSFDPDIRVECTNGIHFFISRREAEEYMV